MNCTNLKALLQVRGLNQSELAKMAGISRQVVSHWFRQSDPQINIHSKNLQKIASCLGVSTDHISRPLPILTNPIERKSLEANLLWDRLYPDLESFVSALIRGQGAALARLAQVYGLYQAEKIVGKVIWDKFPTFKLKISPAQRGPMEVVWKIHQNQA